MDKEQAINLAKRYKEMVAEKLPSLIPQHYYKIFFLST